ncbi:MAG: hypothetical protein OQL10_14625 [Sedimenticola sp.]|nr:hypothetical protein [Sedimenticola sp.]
MGERDLFGDDWLAAQQAFWNQWGEKAGASGGDHSAAVNPWEMALNQWWQTLAPSAPELMQELLGKTVAQAKQLFQLAELFAQNRENSADEFDWQSAIQQTFGDLRGIIAGITGAMNPIPEDMLSDSAIDNSTAYLQRLFSFPGLGIGHRSQAQQREMIARLMTYQKARLAYERFFVDLGNSAVVRLQEKVTQLDSQGERIESARALYDLWVEASESVYAEQVMTPEYVKLYGELINSQMAVKLHMRAMLDDSFTALGMPTTRDFRALEQRAYDDRKVIKQLQAEMLNSKATAKIKVPKKKAVSRKRANAGHPPSVNRS